MKDVDYQLKKALVECERLEKENKYLKQLLKYHNIPFNQMSTDEKHHNKEEKIKERMRIFISWKGTLQQYVGRLHRLHDNKDVVKVYDYVDHREEVFQTMFDKRKKGYKSMGYKIEELESKKNESNEQMKLFWFWGASHFRILSNVKAGGYFFKKLLTKVIALFWR